jgi:hypothetical protein
MKRHNKRITRVFQKKKKCLSRSAFFRTLKKEQKNPLPEGGGRGWVL